MFQPLKDYTVPYIQHLLSTGSRVWLYYPGRPFVQIRDIKTEAGRVQALVIGQWETLLPTAQISIV